MKHSKSHYKLFNFHQYFHRFLLLINQPSKCSPMSHDLSHSQLQLLRFQINPLAHLCLSINYSLHSHIDLSLFHLCLLLHLM